jgi:hypothetical protein
MKKLFLLGLVIATITSCKNEKKRYTQDSAEIEVVKASISAYNAKDYASLTANYADTAKVYYNSAEVLKPSDLVKFHQDNDVNYASRGFIADAQEYEMVEDDDGKTWVNFWGRWKCTLAENGKEFNVRIHLTSQFKDGKIVEEYGYWDSAPLTQELQAIAAAKMQEQQEIEAEKQ